MRKMKKRELRLRLALALESILGKPGPVSVARRVLMTKAPEMLTTTIAMSLTSYLS